MKKFLLLVLALIIPFSLFGCKKNLNKLNTPQNLQVDAGFVIFERVDNDEFYSVFINENEFVITLNSVGVELYNQNKINYLRYDANHLFAFNQTYEIKVQAHASKKKSSDLSASVSYTPKLATPTNVKLNQNILTWDVVNSADYYVVNIAVSTQKGQSEFSETVFQNNFDMSKYLSIAGVYKFRVQAQSYRYPSSAFSEEIQIANSSQLATPTVARIHDVEGELHALVVLDENANMLIANINGEEESFNFDEISNCLTKIENKNVLGEVEEEFIDNFYDLNLTSLLNKFNLDADIYSLSLRVGYNPFGKDLIFTQSNTSAKQNYENLTRLTAPEISFENGVLSWADNGEQNGGYRVYIARKNGLEIVSVSNNPNSNVNNFLIDDNYLALGVVAIGKGEMDSSKMSNLIAKHGAQQNDFAIAQNEQLVSWGEGVTEGYYIVELDNLVFTTHDKFVDLTNYENKFETVTVTAIEDGKTPVSHSRNLDYNSNPIKLPVPEILPSDNLLELKFTALNDALGYYVYFKQTGAVEFKKINHLFTNNVVDLSAYLKNYGEYEVRVQAVADKFGIFVDSQISSSTVFAFKAKLKTPEFAQDGVIQKDGKYYLCFNSVENAKSYEILINDGLPIEVDATALGEFQVDVSNRLLNVGEYNIKVRALPDKNSKAFSASDYASVKFVLRLKLGEVQSLRVVENGGQYSLAFDAVENAEKYNIRIEKAGDENYEQNLQNKGLTNVFQIGTTVLNLSPYILGAGNYYIYVRALANENGYYENSNEIGTSFEMAKTPLSAPKIEDELNNSEITYNLYLSEVEGAQSFKLQITLPNGEVQEISSLTSTINVSDFLTKQGEYKFRAKAIAGANSENLSSPYGEEYILNYHYRNPWDFRRYKVFYDGEETSFEISSVQQFKNLLFYHYLFGVDESYGLTIYIPKSDVVNTLNNFANDATQKNIYNFNADEEYLAAKQNSNARELVEVISKKLLGGYSDINVLNYIRCDQVSSNIFNLYFNNAISVRMGNYPTYLAVDLGRQFAYVPSNERRGVGVRFAIDACEEMEVSTSEQLLQAVLNGRKPKFVNGADAEQIYSNAKAVLRAIITPNMSEQEKVLRIFDWLEYALSNNYYSKRVGESEIGEVSEYGTRADFYLESVFLNLTNGQSSNFDGEFYLTHSATSYSYAKAFSLLCAIEGIETRLAYGVDELGQTQVYNKVYLSISGGEKAWFVVDVFSSDNFVASALENCRDIASHLYFLVSDAFHTQSGISETHKTVDATQNYNYYADSTFALSAQQIGETINVQANAFEYFLQYNSAEKYQDYGQTIDDYSLTKLQAFLLNALIYSASNSSENGAVFELKTNTKIESDLPLVASLLNSLTEKEFDVEILCSLNALENGRTNYTYCLSVKQK